MAEVIKDNEDLSDEQALFRRMREEVLDSIDEELEMEHADLAEEDKMDRPDQLPRIEDPTTFRRMYFRELRRLQLELVLMQDWIAATKHKLVVLFEGRDAAGKGGAIKRITQRLNPRICRVAALPAPTERERTQWYFQRYVAHLPAGGEIVLFDRSWYNRAGVERVMGFCTEEEYQEFFNTVPEFERMLIRSGTQILKYWFSITNDEQEFRFKCRSEDPLKQWKLSPMDLESRRLWELYTKAKEVMLERTSTKEAPWWIVPATVKKRARLNCIAHLLDQVPYEPIQRDLLDLPEREHSDSYHRKEIPDQMIVPEIY